MAPALLSICQCLCDSLHLELFPSWVATRCVCGARLLFIVETPSVHAGVAPKCARGRCSSLRSGRRRQRDWAAELADDDDAYEPIEPGSSPGKRAGNTAATAASRAPSALVVDELPTRAQALQRLGASLLRSRTSRWRARQWERMKLGDLLRSTLVHSIAVARQAPASAVVVW